jgi:hypothetical protein
MLFVTLYFMLTPDQPSACQNYQSSSAMQAATELRKKSRTLGFIFLYQAGQRGLSAAGSRALLD